MASTDDRDGPSQALGIDRIEATARVEQRDGAVGTGDLVEVVDLLLVLSFVR